MEEQKEQIKDPADTAEASINRIPVVEEQPPEPARRKKTGGEENRFGKKPKIAFGKSAPASCKGDEIKSKASVLMLTFHIASVKPERPLYQSSGYFPAGKDVGTEQ